MKKDFFTDIMVKTKNGDMVSIIDLPKEQYEYFLDLMATLRTAYNMATSETKKHPFLLNKPYQIK